MLAKSTPNTTSLLTLPLKMYQYFKYSNSLLFAFDRSHRVASGLLISEVQAFLDLFTETFLDRSLSSITIILIFNCKSNAKTNKIISINRFGITCCYLSSRNIPAIVLFASTFLSNLVLSRSNQCFGCGLDQSHCRSGCGPDWLKLISLCNE